MPVATVRTFGSKMMSCGEKPISSVRMRYARVQIWTLRSIVSACPTSSKAMTTTAAPYRLISRACRLNASSPSFRLIELTIPLPCTHLSPASITSHFELSIMMGTRAMSGSEAISRRNVLMASFESSIASSMFTSMIWAPPSTCWRATARAPS